MHFDPTNPEATISYTEFAVERMKVAGSAAIGPSVLRSMELRAVQDHVLDRLVYQLRAEVLAERVLSTDQQVAFSGDRRVTTPVRVRGMWIPFALAALLCGAGLVVGSVALVVGSMAVALLATLMLYLNPAETVTLTVPVDGTVTVPATYWRKFPEATVVYPDSLGAPIRFAALGEATYRADEDDRHPFR